VVLARAIDRLLERGSRVLLVSDEGAYATASARMQIGRRIHALARHLYEGTGAAAQAPATHDGATRALHDAESRWEATAPAARRSTVRQVCDASWTTCRPMAGARRRGRSRRPRPPTGSRTRNAPGNPAQGPVRGAQCQPGRLPRRRVRDGYGRRGSGQLDVQAEDATQHLVAKHPDADRLGVRPGQRVPHGDDALTERSQTIAAHGGRRRLGSCHLVSTPQRRRLSSRCSGWNTASSSSRATVSDGSSPYRRSRTAAVMSSKDMPVRLRSWASSRASAITRY
jgi:hypothetical protein